MSTKSLSLLMLFTFAASLSGCLGDKTAPEYAEHLSEQEQAKLQMIEGTYRGTLVSDETHQNLGALELHLDPASVAQDSSDNVTKIQKPVVEGTLIYNGLNQSQASFDTYYYNDKSGVFNFSINIDDSNGQKRTIEASGVIQGDTYSGTIDLPGGYSGTFTLTKNAPFTQLQRLNVGRAIAIAASNEGFHGVSPENPGGVYDMDIEYPDSTDELRFLNIFLPQRAVTVSMNVDGFEVTFNKTSEQPPVVNERANSLTGRSSFSLNGVPHKVKLECKRSNQGTPSETWDCYVTTLKTPTHIIFSYVRNAQSESQGR